LANLYATLKQPQELAKLNESIRPFFTDLAKAKTAKIVRTIIELVGTIPNTLDIQINICKESIDWATREKRNFLRQRIESRLAALYFEKMDYPAALALINKLSREVRRLDDKALLVEIHLLESRVQHALKNIPKARAALTAGRTAANAIYCPPMLQADIDMQSGILHAEEKDYKTAFSYLFEAFEGYNSMENAEHQAILCLKYMLLCKVMTHNPEDVQSILSSKNALKYAGPQIDSIRDISNAFQERSLHAFDETLKKYKTELVDDPIVYTHFAELYDSLLEQHLLRIIEPYSRVQISQIAQLIDLPRDKVERKLSQMILDNILNGTLDQGNDCLIVFEETKKDEAYPAALDTIDNMNLVLDSLFARATVLAKMK
jgi:26S proteasome regulatory subunit N6